MTAHRRRPFVLCVALVAAVVGCDTLPGRPTEADRPLHPAEVKDFARLYGENCAGCHGAEGRLGPAPPLSNPVFLALIDDASMRRVITEGVAGTAMSPFGHSAGGVLTDEQIGILIGGIRQRWGRPGAVTGDAPPLYASDGSSDARRGAEVYATFCASCHGPDGRGKDKVGSIVDTAYLALVSDQALRTLVIAGRPDLEHPDWRGDVPGRPLTAQQVTDVVAWLVEKRLRTAAQPAAQNLRGENE